MYAVLPQTFRDGQLSVRFSFACQTALKRGSHHRLRLRVRRLIAALMDWLANRGNWRRADIAGRAKVQLGTLHGPVRFRLGYVGWLGTFDLNNPFVPNLFRQQRRWLTIIAVGRLGERCGFGNPHGIGQPDGRALPRRPIALL
jgi:hypothetical protein